jgi:multidrug efflux pump subunit AcrA (membrane-fusion protein)
MPAPYFSPNIHACQRRRVRPAAPLQLNEALRLAATEHPTAAASRSERKAALMKLDVAERQRYPNLVAQAAGNAVGDRITALRIEPVEDNRIVEAKVKSSDIAFLKPGRDVSAKIDAYDFSIFGGLQGTLTYLSPDTLSEDLKQGEQASYRVQVTTDAATFNSREGEPLTLQPGMTATIEVKTGKNTVLKYLLKPVIKTLNTSMGER